MSKTETELKLTLLSDDPLPSLIERLGAPVRVVEQLNRYFEPAAPPKWMVRLREEGGGLLLTVKGPRSERRGEGTGESTRSASDASGPGDEAAGASGRKGVGGGSSAGVFVREERERAIPSEWLTELADTGTCSALWALDEMSGLTPPLRYRGQLHNTRRSYRLAGESSLLDIDRTVYPDGSIVWELELESDDAAELAPRVRDLLDSVGLRYRASTVGKFGRLLAAAAADSTGSELRP